MTLWAERSVTGLHVGAPDLLELVGAHLVEADEARLGALAAFAAGEGSTPGIGSALPTRVQALSLSGAALVSASFGAWRFDGGPLAGFSWYFRQVSAPGFSAADSSLSPAVGARARLSWSTGWFGLGLTVDGTATWLRVPRGSQGYLGLVFALDLSWSSAR